ncbi:MAG: hypothetical protein FJ388_18145, partial [Verrucomicrobia bacterium]|nr:hypothetical protein [Verrucomicrobiota bacterium]
MKTQIGSFIVSIVVCALAAEPATDMAEVVRDFQADQANLARAYDLPWSEAQFDRVERLCKDWQQRLTKINFDALDRPGRLDYVLLQNEFTEKLDQLAIQRRRMREMNELLPFRRAVQELEQTRWRMEAVNGQASASKIAGVPDQLK